MVVSAGVAEGLAGRHHEPGHQHHRGEARGDAVHRRHQELHDARADGHLRPAPRFDAARRQIANAWYQVRKKVADIEQNLPDGIVGPSSTTSTATSSASSTGLTFDGYSWRQARDFAEAAKAAFLSASDTGKVEIYGDQDEKIYLTFSPEQLAAIGVRLEDVMNAIAAQNAVTPSGVITTPNEDDPDRRLGRAGRHGEPRRDQPLHPGPVLQSHAARHDQPRSRRPADQDVPGQRPAVDRHRRLDARRRQQPDLRRGDRRASRRSSSRISRSASTSSTCPTSPRWCGPPFPASPARCSRRWSSCWWSASSSLGLRAGLVVALSIPLVLAIVFLFLYTVDISLQRISLGALVISLGLLVDDAMITVEIDGVADRGGRLEARRGLLCLQLGGLPDADRDDRHHVRVPAHRPRASRASGSTPSRSSR